MASDEESDSLSKLQKWGKAIVTVLTPTSAFLGLFAALKLESPPLYARGLGGALLFSVGGGIAWCIARTRSAGASKKVAARLVLQLHGSLLRAQPSQFGDLAEGYRVSLFRRQPATGTPTRWECSYRTNSEGRTGVAWPHVTDRELLASAGVVVHVAVNRSTWEVPGVEAALRDDIAKQGEYARRSKASVAKVLARSWPFATILATPAKNEYGITVAVIVVERKDGKALPQGVKRDLELVAETLGALWRDE